MKSRSHGVLVTGIEMMRDQLATVQGMWQQTHATTAEGQVRL